MPNVQVSALSHPTPVSSAVHVELFRPSSAVCCIPRKQCIGIGLLLILAAVLQCSSCLPYSPIGNGPWGRSHNEEPGGGNRAFSLSHPNRSNRPGLVGHGWALPRQVNIGPPRAVRWNAARCKKMPELRSLLLAQRAVSDCGGYAGGGCN